MSPRIRRPRAVLVVSIAVLVVAGLAGFVLLRPGHRTCGRVEAAATTGPAPVSSGGTVPRFSHVIVIVMENHGYSDVIGNPAAPFVNSLARRYALATSFYGVSHPSLPNYLALTGGSTFGVSSDCAPDPHGTIDATNLVDQLATAGISWKAYMEGLPAPCSLGSSGGGYAPKHDPFAYYTDVVNDPSRCTNVVPLTQLGRDVAAGTLPTFVWITPDLCHDMHDCSVARGDAFLSRLIPTLLPALGKQGVLFLTWDERSDAPEGCCGVAHGGHIATVVAGPAARAGATSSTPYSLYSILRTIEDSWGLPELGEAACSCTAPMTDLLRAR